MVDKDAAIGALVREYTENEGKIAALHAELMRIGKDLQVLGRALEGRPSDVRPDYAQGGKPWRVRVIDHVKNTEHALPQESLSFDPLCEHLSELSDALVNKKRMEDYLRRAGLESLIKT